MIYSEYPNENIGHPMELVFRAIGKKQFHDAIEFLRGKCLISHPSMSGELEALAIRLEALLAHPIKNSELLRKVIFRIIEESEDTFAIAIEAEEDRRFGRKLTPKKTNRVNSRLHGKVEVIYSAVGLTSSPA